MQGAISNEGPCYNMITEKQQQKNITCVWFLVYFVSTSYRYTRCDEIVLLPITLDCRQGVRENLMKGQGVRVRIKVKNHCCSPSVMEEENANFEVHTWHPACLFFEDIVKDKKNIRHSAAFGFRQQLRKKWRKL